MTTRREDDWARLLSRHLGLPVAVRYGRSRTAPVQAIPGRPGLEGGYLVRLHHFFESAPDTVAADLAAWLRAGRRARAACRRLDAWIAERCEELPPAAPRVEAVRPVGAYHDLERLAQRVVDAHLRVEFAHHPAPPVTWGRRGKSRARRSLRLGSYCASRRLVRIHPVLDSPDVPEWFVASVLHHELLHAALGEETDARGRRLHHGPAFRARERDHPDHDRALAWQRKHVARLIRAARRGDAYRAPRWSRGRADARATRKTPDQRFA